MFFYFLLIFALTSEVWVQCNGVPVGEKATVQSYRVSPEDELVIEDHAKRPCLCKGYFYPNCPKKLCQLEDTYASYALRDSISALDHDTDHPDHVINNNLHSDLVTTNMDPSYYTEIGRAKDVVKMTAQYPKESNLEYDNDGRVLTHRKIYVPNEHRKQEPVIHPIHITIPVEIPEEIDSNVYLEPMFRMHNHTILEKKSEVEMVPVTTTIIKPKRISRKQIIS